MISMNRLFRKKRRLAKSPGANGSCFRPLILLSLLCIAAFGIGCGQKRVAGNQDAPAVAVKTVVMQPVSISDASEYLATLKSRHSTALNPQVEGQVTHIFVRSGDRVAAGTRLMQIDPL